MWELDYKERWAPKNWYFWTVVLEKTLESPLDCKEIQPVHPQRNQSWIFIGRTDAEAETPIFWQPDGKNWLIWKDSDSGKDWRREVTCCATVHGVAKSQTWLSNWTDLASIHVSFENRTPILLWNIILLQLNCTWLDVHISPLSPGAIKTFHHPTVDTEKQLFSR